ncbi:MAG: GNAT family N-acetyltransferase [Parvibaculaceae bacterium]
MTNVTVRRLRAGDALDDAYALLVRFFREEQFDTPDETIIANTRRMAGIDLCGLFLAAANGDAIGVATVSIEFGIEYGYSAEMGDLYVVPEWRGRGVSRKLVVAVEDYLRAMGSPVYRVTLAPYGEEAHGLSQFYSALGFENEGRLILSKTIKG